MNFSEILETEDLDLKIGHWECGIENLGMKILNWKFGVWKILENFEKYFFFLGWLSFWLSFKCGGWNFGPPLSFVSLISFSFFVCLFHLSPPLFLHCHYSLSSSPWIFFFISPFLLTTNTFLSFSSFPHPSLSISL